MAVSKNKPGRPPIGERALCAQVFARLTSQQHDRYLALGGAKWLRDQLDIAEGRQRAQPTPTAHQPFPPVFVVTDFATGEPVAHTVTIREH